MTQPWDPAECGFCGHEDSAGNLHLHRAESYGDPNPWRIWHGG
jgi:hypothetical protein